MPLRDRKINNFVEFWCPVASEDLDIWVLSTSFQKIDIGWPQQPPSYKVPKFNLIFHDSNKKYLLSKHQRKVEFKNLSRFTLKTSVVIFQVLTPLQPLQPLWPQQPRWPQWPRQPHFIKKFTQHDGWIIPSPQMTNTSPFLWNGSSKIHWHLIPFSLEAVEASLCQFLWKLVDETQISNPPEPTLHHKSIKLWILLSLRADLLVTLQYEIPCMTLS